MLVRALTALAASPGRPARMCLWASSRIAAGGGPAILSEPEPARAAGDGQGCALRDQLVGGAGTLAGAIGGQELGLNVVDQGQGPGAGLAQELALVLPEHA